MVSSHEYVKCQLESQEGHQEKTQASQRVDQEVGGVDDEEKHHIVAEVLEVHY